MPRELGRVTPETKDASTSVARSRPLVSGLLSAPRRFTYLAAGVVLAAGAPVGLAVLKLVVLDEFGLLALRRAVGQDGPAFVYVTVSTMAVFAAFGHVLGRQADALVALARCDPLTGLHNQRAFEERLVDEVARAVRYRTALSLLLVDVDGLKAINDAGGHRAGDDALRLVADALRHDARQTDLAARIGGDEFGLIAPDIAMGEASALGDRIREVVAAYPGAGVTISVGVATLEVDGPGATALLEAADAALYEAKRRGRNRVVPAPVVGYGMTMGRAAG